VAAPIREVLKLGRPTRRAQCESIACLCAALVWLGGPLVDPGYRRAGPSRQEWEERERRVYWSLRGASIRIERTGHWSCLSSPVRRWRPLEDPELEGRSDEAIDRRSPRSPRPSRGTDHGDAMARTLIDLAAGVARGLTSRPAITRGALWRGNADDVRPCSSRAAIERSPRSSPRHYIILDVYSDEDVTCVLASTFATSAAASATFHLAQAGLSFSVTGRSPGCERASGRLALRSHRAVFAW
jgi:hypothetical protein